MTRSKAFTLALIILFPFMVGCASVGMKKPTVFIDKPNNIPADIPSQFLDRYYFLIDKEDKEFKKLATDEERQAFQDKFWLDRDTDPTTPENERKIEIDERIDNIANDIFLNIPGVFGLSFRMNGGFRGDMAHVYLLHGEPDAMDTIEGQSFANLMLWVYGNPENGSTLFAFLFYQKGSEGGPFKLFPQDSYQLDRCGALNEVATRRTYNYTSVGLQNCPEELYQIYEEIWNASGKGGFLNGNVFAWALFNFSSDSSLKQGEALESPKPASEIAKQSNARVTGEAPELVGKEGTNYILASCESCNSMIPAELSLGERFTISGPWKNFDWTVEGGYLELSLKYRIILESRNSSKPLVIEDTIVMDVKRGYLDEYPEAIVFVELMEPAQVTAIPPGTYRVSIYIKNTMTKKSNAWDKEFTK